MKPTIAAGGVLWQFPGNATGNSSGKSPGLTIHQIAALTGVALTNVCQSLFAADLKPIGRNGANEALFDRAEANQALMQAGFHPMVRGIGPGHYTGTPNHHLKGNL